MTEPRQQVPPAVLRYLAPYGLIPVRSDGRSATFEIDIPLPLLDELVAGMDVVRVQAKIGARAGAIGFEFTGATRF